MASIVSVVEASEVQFVIDESMLAELQSQATSIRQSEARASNRPESRESNPEKTQASNPEKHSPAPRFAVLPVLIPAEHVATSVQAEVPVRLLGSGHYHGYSLAQVGFPVEVVENLKLGQRLRLFTAAEAPGKVVKRQRFDAAADLAARRSVQRWAVNPEQLSSYHSLSPLRKVGDGTTFSPTEAPSLEGSPVEMLILTNAALLPAFQDYAEERSRFGIPTTARSIEWVAANYAHGADLQETLRDFVRKAYELWGIRYLLIGGDTDIVPTRFVHVMQGLEADEVPTDLYYACLDGNWNGDGDAFWGEGYVESTGESDMADIYPELYVGRIPIHNLTELAQYRNKFNQYQQPSVMDYQDQILFFAEVLWPSNYVPGGSIFKNGADIAERLINLADLDEEAIQIKKLYETYDLYPGSLPLTRQASIDEMNASHGIVMHIGHGFRYTMSLGDQSLTNVQAATLANQNRPFFLTMLNCTATAYDFPALAEQFLLNADGGAVGVIGASREAFPDNIQLYQEEWFKKLFGDKLLSAAQALHESRLRFVSRSFEDGAYRWSYFITSYLGDPTIDVWRASPQVATVDHPSSVTLGQHNLSFSITNAGAPVNGARVCLWKEGDFYAVGRTGFDGEVSMSVRAEAVGTASVSVSGAGLLPYEGSLQINEVSGRSLRATGFLLLDDAGAGTIGNGNGVLEAGEEVFIQVELRNEGGLLAENIEVVLHASDPFLSIVDKSVAAPNLNPGQSGFSSPAKIRFSEETTDQHRVKVNLNLQSQAWSWEDEIYLDLMQVEPRIHTTSYRDNNLDGVIGAGESYYLDIEFKNYGSAQLDDVTATLFSSDPDVEIIEANTVLGDIPRLQSGTATFRLREYNVDVENPMYVILMNGGGRIWTFPIETRIPDPVDNLANDAGQGARITVLTWDPSPTPDVVGYRVLRRQLPYGSWEVASADLVRTATYFRDDGLTPNTSYGYVVQAVDESGNQSLVSSESIATTNPGQNPGWPKLMAQWSNSAPLVVDLDGDLNFEIITGADALYAWDATGNELKDGDANPATDGVWAADAPGFAAGLAAADFDGDGGDEIVACSWDERAVFLYDGDGSVMPGWPQYLKSGSSLTIWATPAIGDLDYDGSLEIVVLGLDGYVYAWHWDGTEFLDGDADPTTHGVFFEIPQPANWSRGEPVIADVVTDDATQEIIFGATNHNVYVLRADGSIAPGWPRNTGHEVTAAPSIADIDRDGALEIAVPSRSGQLFVFRGDGTDLPGWPVQMESNWVAFTPSVAFANLLGDERLELVVGGGPAVASEGSLYLFDSNGELAPGWPVEVETASEASPIIGDIDLDGIPEIIYGGESGLIHGFTPDGQRAPGFPIKLGAELRATPALFDVDRDSDVDLVVSGWDQQVYVFDFAGGYIRSNIPWGTHKGNQRRNGRYEFRLPTDAESDVAPKHTRLFANVPNPFNPATTIHFDLAGSGKQKVALRIFDVQGRLIRTLVDEPLSAGRHRRVWNGRDNGQRAVASGVYFYRLETHEVSTSRKMILLR